MNAINEILDYFFAEGAPVDPVWDQRCVPFWSITLLLTALLPFALGTYLQWASLDTSVCWGTCQAAGRNCCDVLAVPADVCTNPLFMPRTPHSATQPTSTFYFPDARTERAALLSRLQLLWCCCWCYWLS
jgi:hypothetical protein